MGLRLIFPTSARMYTRGSNNDNLFKTTMFTQKEESVEIGCLESRMCDSSHTLAFSFKWSGQMYYVLVENIDDEIRTLSHDWKRAVAGIHQERSNSRRCAAHLRDEKRIRGLIDKRLRSYMRADLRMLEGNPNVRRRIQY